jgi:hypothetical protein
MINPFKVKRRNQFASILWLNSWCIAILFLEFSPTLKAYRHHHPYGVWLWLPVLTVVCALLSALTSQLLWERRARRYKRLMKRL